MKPVRVMVVEDDPEDMELMADELRRGGFSAELCRQLSGQAKSRKYYLRIPTLNSFTARNCIGRDE